ncbi:MAG: hypothetical protein NC313_07525 [Butyrivibrio sp.]|nr:hypothetical protein [Butyrivibrio sp.]
MLATEGLQKFLSGEDKPKDYKDYNNDHDFGKVLQYCGDGVVHNRELLCSDGQKRFFSFDN